MIYRQFWLSLKEKRQRWIPSLGRFALLEAGGERVITNLSWLFKMLFVYSWYHIYYKN